MGIALGREIRLADPAPNDAPPPDHCSVQWLAWDAGGRRIAAVSSAPFGDREGIDQSFGRLHVVDSDTLSWGDELAAKPLLLPESAAWMGDIELAVLEEEVIAICHAGTGRRLRELSIADADPTCIAAHPDYQILAAAFSTDAGCEIAFLSSINEDWMPSRVRVPTDIVGIASLGWSSHGYVAAIGVNDTGDMNALLVWTGAPTEPQLVARLDVPGFIENATVSQGWFGSRLFVAGELTGQLTEYRRGTEALLRPTLFRWSPFDGVAVFDLYGVEGGFFSAVTSPLDGIVSCSTGQELLLFNIEDPAAPVGHIDVFRTSGGGGRTVVDVMGPDGARVGEATLSAAGFNLCHAWSPQGGKLATGNVLGLTFWDFTR